jgi:hypothetical protein
MTNDTDTTHTFPLALDAVGLQLAVLPGHSELTDRIISDRWIPQN